ncbi:MAG: B12-binding domain-containing radical SAM protein, partial [Deltaproteobacteria bacterium]|nr:B12-binding domain-containing radical SAM protein [Deltaproteobacteria bacterium]
MRELLPLVPRPGRYLGIEEGAVRPRAANGRSVLRCALAFPDLYEVGMSYLGQKILYAILNARPGTTAERVFAPCRETAALLRARRVPLATLESDTPLAATDVIGFSITHELCYTNVLYMLDLAGIPLRAADRIAGDWPLVLAGGGCTLAAEPLAPFVDAMVLGEGEACLPEILDVLAASRSEHLGRPDLLRRLARLPGVYVPGLFIPDAAGGLAALEPELPRPTRRVAPDLDQVPYPSRQVVPFGAVHNRLSLEIARGCTRGCRFCQAGMIYRPARERGLPAIARLLDHCLRDTGFDEVSLLALSSGDFSGLCALFGDVADRCGREQISLALPSLRVGSVDDAILRRLAGIRRTGITLAP